MRIKTAGFTLIELVTVVAIVGILSGIGIPSMRTLLEHQRATSASSTLHSHIALARLTAITHNHRTMLCPSADGIRCSDSNNWSQGWMTFVDSNNNRKLDADDEILRVEQAFNPQLRIVSGAGRQQLRYLPDGRSAGSNLTFSICNQRGELLNKVIVNNVGRPRSERPKQPTPCPA